MKLIGKRRVLPGQDVEAAEWTRAASQVRPTAEPRGPSLDRVRALAHRFYEARMREGTAGDAMSDWLRAEQELGIATIGPAAPAEPVGTGAAGAG